MERLTKRAKRVSGLPGVCCTHFESGDCVVVAGHCSDGCPWEEAAWDRLAAYEDTGLEPEEIQRILDEYGRGMSLKTSCADRLAIIKDVPTSVLREVIEQYQQMKSPNPPLTLEELREMDGDKVWIERIGGRTPYDSAYARVSRENCLCRTNDGCNAFFELYGISWLAYRRKP